MEHLLDNPIYHSLNTKHRPFAVGDGAVLYYQENVAPFAGLKTNSAAEFELLHQLSAPDCTMVLFTPVPYDIPQGWKLTGHINMLQLVYTADVKPQDNRNDFENLAQQHVEEMIELVKLTQPGPFRSRTIELSNYTGIFQDQKLVAMAGHRMHPEPYIEISAVCTHPDHVGKGYAYTLLYEQIERILAKDQIPFLHVRDDNDTAIRLYQRLGLEIRTPMLAYILQKQ